jgi:putative tryptophan/tyrosine transport system substrate-binding protein
LLVLKQILALTLALGSLCGVAAPVSIGFLAPDEEPRYSSLLLGLRQGLLDAGMGTEEVRIIEHRVKRGEQAKAHHAADALRAGDARVVFVVGTELAKSVRSVSSTLPIVFITPGDPVSAGLAASLARPDNNLTGMTFEFAELSAKRIELLKEITPSAHRIGIVFDRRDNSPRQGFAAAAQAAKRIGLQLVELDVQTLARGGNLAALVGKLDGMVLIPGGAIASVTEVALRLAATQRIVSVVWARRGATGDATVSYGVDDVEIARSAARAVVRVLNGRNAGDLPIEQPTRFELVVNLKAAKALGIAVPQSLLVRANEVIQ